MATLLLLLGCFALFLMASGCGGGGGGGSDSNASNDGSGNNGGGDSSSPTTLVVTLPNGGGVTAYLLNEKGEKTGYPILDENNVSPGAKFEKTLTPDTSSVLVEAKELAGKTPEPKEAHVSVVAGQKNSVEITYKDQPTTGTIVVKLGNSVGEDKLRTDVFKTQADIYISRLLEYPEEVSMSMVLAPGKYRLSSDVPGNEISVNSVYSQPEIFAGEITTCEITRRPSDNQLLATCSHEWKL